MITTGGFQDLVQLSLDTLYHLGPMFNVGDSLASTVTMGWSNSGGSLALVWSATSNQTLGMATGNGTLLTNVNISAGSTSSNVSAVTFSNANNVSFGFDGTNITASINVSAANINISAGTTSNESSAFTFANGSNVSFGINAGTITASVASSLTGINVSAGTTSNNLSAVTFANSNNASFGLNASTVTVSAPVNFSAGTTSNNLTQLSFSNGSNVSFGLNAGTLTASVASSLTGINISAGTTSNNLSAAAFSNSYNVSFGLNGSTVTASANLTGDYGATSDAAVRQAWTRFYRVAQPGRDSQVNQIVLDLESPDDTTIEIGYSTRGSHNITRASRSVAVSAGKSRHTLGVNAQAELVCVKLEVTGSVCPDIHYIGFDVDVEPA